MLLRNWDTFVQWAQMDPVNFISFILTMIVSYVMSLVLHECAHGWMALRCGDPTAKMLGRLSLNPLRHLDPVGTICIFFFGFGWAKPVPVNPRNFENYRRDDFLVSIAGIVTNLSIFIICSLLATVVNMFLWQPETLKWLQMIEGSQNAEQMVNLFSRTTNMSHSIVYLMSYETLTPFVTQPWLLYVQRALLMIADVNLMLAIFNLIPLPPLDGFHVLNDVILGGKLQ